jgi:8-oxo-dGTP pyrophosphatase MutT (NUDIX family)
MSDLIKGTDYIGVCVTFFCHDGKGRFLMSKRGKKTRDERGTWDIGAGGLEFGDDIFERIRTEVKEEYCTNVIEIEFLGYRNVHREHDGRPTHWVGLDFKVLVDPTKVKNGEPDILDDVQWFTPDMLPEGLHSEMPKFFRDYKDRL